MKNKRPINKSKKAIIKGDSVINIGLTVFEDSLKQQGIRVVSVDASPTYKVAKDLQSILDKLI